MAQQCAERLLARGSEDGGDVEIILVESDPPQCDVEKSTRLIAGI